MKQQGTTFFELLIVLTLIAIFVSFSSVTLTVFHRQVTQAQIASTWLTRLNALRVESMMRHVYLGICPSLDNKTCDINWNFPIAVFQLKQQGNDWKNLKLLHKFTDSASDMMISWRALRLTQHRIIFSPEGSARGLNGRLVITDLRQRKTIILYISPTGRIRQA